MSFIYGTRLKNYSSKVSQPPAIFSQCTFIVNTRKYSLYTITVQIGFCCSFFALSIKFSPINYLKAQIPKQV